MRMLALALVAFSMAFSTSASATDLAAPTPPPPVFARSPLISEIRLGVFAHDPGSPESGSADINGEILTPKLLAPSDPILALLVPRLHIGGTVNTAGKTSSAYAGLTWTFDVTRQVFVEGSFGVAVHNGDTGRLSSPNRAALGCSPLMRESGSIGYRLTSNWTVMATVEHMSNAGVCSENRGLTNYGVRLGYVF